MARSENVQQWARRGPVLWFTPMVYLRSRAAWPSRRTGLRYDDGFKTEVAEGEGFIGEEDTFLSGDCCVPV